MNSLIYRKDSKKDLYELRNALEEALKSNQFGIMTEIDVAKVMKKKGIEFDKELLLLGVCNPEVAKEALTINSDVSVSLPCSITIEKTETGSTVKLARPSFIVNYYKNEGLDKLGERAEDTLVQAINEVV